MDAMRTPCTATPDHESERGRERWRLDGGQRRGWTADNVCTASTGIAKVLLGVWSHQTEHHSSALREKFQSRGVLLDAPWRQQSHPSFIDIYKGVHTGGAMEVNAGAYVINLLRRPERKARMQALCAPLVAQELPVEFLAATDALELDGPALTAQGIRLFHPWQSTDSPNRFHNRKLRAGEVACGLSHLRVWQAAAARQLDLTVVLEDDATFEADMWEQLRAALRHVDREWDLLYLGRCAPRSDHCDLSQYTRTGERVSACLVVPGFSYCTYGYVLSARGLQRVLAARYEETVMPLDEFLPALYTTHPRADVTLQLADRERLVALAWSGEGERELVTQYEVGQVTIVGSDTEDSGDMDVMNGCIVRVSQSARVGLRDELASIRSRAANPMSRFAQEQRLRQEEAGGRL